MSARGVVLALALVPFAALAQTDPEAYLARIDGNHDGRVSVDEYVAYMGAGFRRLDANHDGVLEAAEMPGGRARKPLTAAAHRRHLKAAFQRQDANHDGFLDARELAAPPR